MFSTFFCPMAPYFLTSTFVGKLDEEIGLEYIPRYDLFQLSAMTKTFNLFAKPSFAASAEIQYMTQGIINKLIQIL